MKDEKMMILSMLEEGKITSEEAIKLLEALEDVEMNNKERTKESHNNYHEEKSFKPLFDTLEEIGMDIGNALSGVFDGIKDMGSSFGFKSNYETMTTNLDMDLSGIENPSLDLKAINGKILMRPTDGDKLLIKVTCQYKEGQFNPNESYFDFYRDEDRIVFFPKHNSNISIGLDVLLPDKSYGEILLNSSNGKIEIEDLNAALLKCITTNGAINIADVESSKIDLTTKNGRIECSDITSDMINAITTNSGIILKSIESEQVEARTANGRISINDIKAERIICKTSNSSIEAGDISTDIINLSTNNGKITFNDIDSDKVKEIILNTSNGSINADINKVSDNIYFDLETSMGNIILDFPNLLYKTNKQVNLGLKKIIAHGVDFDENNKHMKFIATTSNGSIKIN